MKIDRRTFLVTSGVIAGGAAISSDALADHFAPSALLPHDDPAFLQGDPFDACVHDRGFGGSSWNDARALAMRHRLADPWAHHREELRHA